MATLLRRWLGNVEASENGRCLIWTGPINGDGYPQFCVGTRRREPFTWLAERYLQTEMWKLPLVTRSNGSYRLSFRTCGNRLCVSPYCRTGYRSPDRPGFKGRLTPEQVRAIRADPRSQRDLAPEYGMHPAHIGHIRRGRSYAWVD